SPRLAHRQLRPEFRSGCRPPPYPYDPFFPKRLAMRRSVESTSPGYREPEGIVLHRRRPRTRAQVSRCQDHCGGGSTRRASQSACSISISICSIGTSGTPSSKIAMYLTFTLLLSHLHADPQTKSRRLRSPPAADTPTPLTERTALT